MATKGAKRASKVQPAEYSETVEEVDLTGTQSAPEPTTDAEGWELGKPAPSTQYLGYDSGEVGEDIPHRGKVIVFEGAQVTQHILRQLGKA